MLERRSAFRVVPGVGEQHTADIPENGANGRQRFLPAEKSGKEFRRDVAALFWERSFRGVTP